MNTVNLAAWKTAVDILQRLSEHQRLIEPPVTGKHAPVNDICTQKIIDVVQKQAPLLLVLPAFPAKSPNPAKTASHLPDIGERLSLKFLNDLCHRISQFYTPGASILICSDGRVFNDLLHVCNEHVTAYAEGIAEIIQQEQLSYTKSFDLDDYFSGMSFDAMRNQLMQNFGEELASLKHRIKVDAAAKLQFNGIHRFIYEDQLSLQLCTSKNSIRNHAKEIAYQVILRSNAWSRLIEQRFPEAIRLSIHPQRHDSDKIGIMLLQSQDVWMTPWHSVALFDGKDYRLVKRQQAEQMQAEAVFVQGRFSHYVMQG